jgi:hypothetical protein
MTGVWYEEHPELVEQIRVDLRASYGSLHLFIEPDGRAEVRGTFPVRSADGVERDRFSVSIELRADYPESLPVVRETGGRIPWKADFHVEEADGAACVLIPDDRWRSFPQGAPFRQFLDGPVYDYFLAQSLVALGEPWPFGQWSHGGAGLLEYYRELLQTTDDLTVARFVYVLAQPLLNRRCDCPCGSTRKLRDCCLVNVLGLRGKIPWPVVSASAKKMGFTAVPYKGRRLR